MEGGNWEGVAKMGRGSPLLHNNSTHDPEPLEEGQLEEEAFSDNQVWAAVLAQEEQHHTEVIRQQAEHYGMLPSMEDSCDKEEVEQMLQDTQARMEQLSLELDEQHLLVPWGMIGEHIIIGQDPYHSHLLIPYHRHLGHVTVVLGFAGFKPAPSCVYKG
ncbi:hypothetical protein BJY52DRAFT_1225146 [Lactarius psammicola]|nr:hypothetical protein BJY52DRAFT_1225146 [Lactarius psammicola]